MIITFVGCVYEVKPCTDDNTHDSHETAGERYCSLCRKTPIVGDIVYLNRARRSPILSSRDMSQFSADQFAAEHSPNSAPRLNCMHHRSTRSKFQ